MHTSYTAGKNPLITSDHEIVCRRTRVKPLQKLKQIGMLTGKN